MSLDTKAVSSVGNSSVKTWDNRVKALAMIKEESNEEELLHVVEYSQYGK